MKRMAFLLISMMMIMLLSAAPACAADIRFDTEDIRKWDSIYLGEYSGDPIEWLIMDEAKNSMDGDGMFLITRNGLYETFSANVKYYPSSGLPEKCQALFDTFDEPEQEIVLSTRAERIDEYEYNSDFRNITEHAVNDEKVFLMSTIEFRKYLLGTGYGLSNGSWYLRSNTERWSGHILVNAKNQVRYTKQGKWYFRPSMNINPDSVAFISPAEGGKEHETGLFPMEEKQNVSAWKLTLMDATREFSASAGTEVYSDDRKLVIDYSGAEVQNNEYISAFLLDSKGHILSYGALCKCLAARGSLEITLPEDLENGSYVLQVFTEQRNGDKRSDYVSAAADLPFTLKDRPLSPDPGAPDPGAPDPGAPDAGIPETDSPENTLPKTGDAADLILWLVCLAGSAAGMLSLTVRRKMDH